MWTTRWTAVLLVLLGLCGQALAGNVSELLEKGVFTEETVGDLEEAIIIYKRVLREDRANRACAAHAQYRLGMCYLKLGREEEGLAAMEQCVARYPGQSDLVQAAAAILARHLGNRVSKNGPRSWVYFESRETGQGPELVLTFQDGAVRVPASGDSVLISYLAQGAYGSHRSLSVAMNDCNRVLIGFALPEGGRAETLQHAHLVLNMKQSKKSIVEAFDLAVHMVTGDWSEAGTTWLSQPAFYGEPAAVAFISPKPGTVMTDVTEVVRGWLRGAASNRGFLLKTGSPFYGPPPLDTSGGGTKYAEEEVRQSDVDALFRGMVHGRIGYHYYSGLWALIAKADMGDAGVRRQIVTQAKARLADSSRWGYDRWLCCFVLSGIGDEASIPALAGVLLDDPDASVREGAAAALGEFNNEAAEKALESAAGQEDNQRVLAVIERALAGEYRGDGAKPAYTQDVADVEDEPTLGAKRDAAVEQGNLVKACEWEMRRVLLRAKTGHVYKDKIDLASVYETFVQEVQPTEEQKRVALTEAQVFGNTHEGEKEYTWRVHHLLSAICKDLEYREMAMGCLDQALEAYPVVDYAQPSKHSKFQHLANQRAELLWDTEGFEAAKEWALGQLRTDPRYDYFFDLPWRKRLGESLGAKEAKARLDELGEGVLDAYEARKVAFPDRAPLIDRCIAELRGKGSGRPAQGEANSERLDALLESMVSKLEKGETMKLWREVNALADLKDPRAIPTMIGVIDADNTYNTVYGVGYFGLRRLTGVQYDENHDGPWWHRWWEENKSQYPEDVRGLEIPVFKKTTAPVKQKAEASGWGLAGSDPKAYEMGIDETVTYRDEKVTGRDMPTRYLKSVKPNPQGFGTMMQQGPAEKLRGQRVRLSADVKTEDIAEWAGLWMRIDGPDNACLGFDNMADRPIKGTADWTKYEIVLDVPENAERVACGILLDGAGTVWLANMDAEDVGQDVPVTGRR
jgi:HEAT repeats/Tetratricopeptide repeat